MSFESRRTEYEYCILDTKYFTFLSEGHVSYYTTVRGQGNLRNAIVSSFLY